MHMEEKEDGALAGSQTQSGSPVATEAAAASQKALALLARCEQCRSGLERKLLQKGYSKLTVEGVLDALEERDFLSDRRFARAWLNSRRIGHYEGRSRLLSELAARGIDKEISKEAVDSFFEEFDEGEICRKAAKKFVAQGKSGEKLMASMQRAGFSYKMAAAALRDVLGE